MKGPDEFNDIESLLKRYRPAGPDAGLRWCAMHVSQSTARKSGRSSFMLRFAAAAMIALCVGVQWATLRTDQRIAAMLATPDRRWSESAEEAIAILGGDENARRYIQLALAADERRLSQRGAIDPMSTFSGVIP